MVFAAFLATFRAFRFVELPRIAALSRRIAFEFALHFPPK